MLASLQIATPNIEVVVAARLGGDRFGRDRRRRRLGRRLALLAFAAACSASAGALAASIAGDGRPAPLGAPLKSLPAPYAGVDWAQLSYPGLDCPAKPVLADPGLTRVIVDQLAEVSVAGRADPVAIAVVSCNFNVRYANVFAFVPDANPRRPRLVQRLALLNGTVQPGNVTTSPGRIDLLGAGYGPPGYGMCCPNVITNRIWRWDGRRFRAAPPAPVTQVVVPDIVGMRLDEADEMLAAVGILWYDANPIDNSPFDERSVVVAVSPKPGSVVHPPKFQLTVSARGG